MPVDYSGMILSVAPEMVLVIMALGVLFLDVSILRTEPIRSRFYFATALSCLGCIISFVWIGSAGPMSSVGPGMLVPDRLSMLVKQGLLVLTFCSALVCAESRFTEHVGEFFAVLLLATVGMMFLVSSENLLMIFISLELTSLALYSLAGFDRRRGSGNSAEASLKYFLFGGVAAAFTLYGLSFVYGLSGSIQLTMIAEGIRNQGMSNLLLVAIVMTATGFGFKVAAVPFHLWAPGTYQGANTCAVAFIASASKLAGFVVLAKVMMIGFASAAGSGSWRDFEAGWISLLTVLALLSLLLGNLAAIVQTDVKKLLAYSAVAHAGYALLGILANDARGVTALVYYVFTYGLATVGAFAVVLVMEERGDGTHLNSFAGLSKRSPALAFCMMVFLLSLAGIPPLAGFFGKFYIFSAAVGAAPQFGLLWIVAIAIAMSAVSLYYYLQVLKQMYVREPETEVATRAVSPAALVPIALIAAAVVALGCAPDLVLHKLSEAVQGLHFVAR